MKEKSRDLFSLRWSPCMSRRIGHNDSLVASCSKTMSQNNKTVLYAKKKLNSVSYSPKQITCFV
jgi:hypothetical protein